MKTSRHPSSGRVGVTSVVLVATTALLMAGAPTSTAAAATSTSAAPAHQSTAVFGRGERAMTETVTTTHRAVQAAGRLGLDKTRPGGALMRKDPQTAVSPGNNVAVTLSAGYAALTITNGAGGSIGVALPTMAGGVVAPSGEALFTGRSHDLVVREVKGGAQALTTVKSRADSHTFKYALLLPNGARVSLNADGGVDFVMRDSGGKTHKLGHINPAWAVDSAGKPVATRFDVVGDSVIQTISRNPSTTYPVVSDPAIYLSVGWATSSWYLSRDWTARIANYVGRYANASAGAVAGAFGVACSPLGGIGAAVCAMVGAIYGGFAIDQFVAARNRWACIRIRVSNWYPYNAVLGIYVDNTSYCKSY